MYEETQFLIASIVAVSSRIVKYNSAKFSNFWFTRLDLAYDAVCCWGSYQFAVCAGLSSQYTFQLDVSARHRA